MSLFLFSFFFSSEAGGGGALSSLLLARMGLGSSNSRKQKNMLKTTMSTTAVMLTALPHRPRLNGPRGKFCRRVSTLAMNGMAYETVVRMMKDPVRSRKAVELPVGMAPRPVATTAVDFILSEGAIVRRLEE